MSDFPKIGSEYTHDRPQAIIMAPCIDYAPDREPLRKYDFTRRFSGFTGKYLMTPNSRPLLHGTHSCKVATQLLEGIVHMVEIG